MGSRKLRHALKATAVWAAVAAATGIAPAQPPPGPPRTGPGYPQVYDPNMPFDAEGDRRHLDAERRRVRWRRALPRLRRPRLQPRVSRVHAGGAGRVRREHSVDGRALGSADAEAHPEEHIGRRRAQPPALGTDLYQQCNPMGIPRAILYPDPEEFIVLPDRILQHFQWGYGLRTIWMDGRALPKPEEVDIARWWGYAVGRWEGNTLVVTSTGYDGRTWVDHFGYPHSDMMVLEERYTRINYDTLELKMTLTDPVYYQSRGCRKRSACI